MLENTRALFGANVRHARLKAKLTQVQVQELTGIQQHYISELENGWHNPTLDAWLPGFIAAYRPAPKAERGRHFRRPQLGLRRQRTISLQLVHCTVRRSGTV
jgi:DNA-binding XRE family transcriptional regulator